MPKKKTALTIEERLQQALVPAEEQPYEVPENWVWVRLESICEHTKAGGDKPNDFSTEKVEGKEIPVVANGIEDEGVIGYTSCSGEVSGSITVAGRGTIGYSFLRMYEFFPVVRLLVVRPYDFVNLKMLKYVFDAIPEKGKGSSIPQLTIPMIKEKAIPLPPLSEQQRIVERIEELFAKLDEARERLQEVADSFAVRKAAILHKAFTGELTKQWRRENGVSDESWEEKKLSEITENQDSKRIPLSKSQRDNMNRIYDYYGASGIIDKVDDYIFEGKKLLIGEDGANLVTRSKDIAFIADGKYWVNNHAHILDVKDTVLLMYLCHYINNMDLIPYVTGSAQPKLTQAKMNNIKILLPSLPEQHEIVRLIDNLLARERAAQQAAEQALASIDLMKKSILARAFRGELGTNKASEASALELLRQVLAEG